MSLADDVDAVLAPIDGSDCSFRALAFAADLADRYAATLDVVHVTDEHTAATDDLVGRAHTLLDARDVDAEVEVVVDLDLEFRPAEQVGETVLHLVTDRGYDHVVVGHHGAGAFEKAMVGSTAETLLAGDRVPVTVIP
jgi:nucleotide-binding universal stress UspA family protein